MSDENRIILDSIYTNRLTAPLIDLESLLVLIKMFNTKKMDLEVLGKVRAYWMFSKACIDNIVTGKWNTLPSMWFDVLDANQDVKMNPYQVSQELESYLAYREERLATIDIKAAEFNDPEVIEHWVLNPEGEKDMLMVAGTLLRAYLEFTNTTLEGEDKEEGTVLKTFNTANKGMGPRAGSTKQEFTRDIKDHPTIIKREIGNTL